MKKLIFIALLMNSLLVFNNSMIHAQMYFPPVFTPPYYFYNYPASYGYSWVEPFLTPWSFQGTGNYKVVNWPYNSFSLKPGSFSGIQSQILVESIQSTSLSKIPLYQQKAGTPPFARFDGTDIFMPFSLSHMNILNPESPLYYLNPESPYHGTTLPKKTAIRYTS